MTEIERKALALVAQLQEEDDGRKYSYAYHFEALCRAIKQHEAFAQDVSDAVEMCDGTESPMHRLHRFIIAKPDPLVEALNGYLSDCTNDECERCQNTRAALAGDSHDQ